jgi:hypothetical protein
MATGAAGIVATALVLLPSVPVFWAVPSFALAGFGMGLAYSSFTLVVLSEARAGAQGSATASLQLSDTLGTALGTGTAGAFVAAAGGSGLGARSASSPSAWGRWSRSWPPSSVRTSSGPAATERVSAREAAADLIA